MVVPIFGLNFTEMFLGKVEVEEEDFNLPKQKPRTHSSLSQQVTHPAPSPQRLASLLLYVILVHDNHGTS